MQVPVLPASFQYSAEYMRTSFVDILAHLQQRASYIFQAQKWKRWKLRTWAKGVRACEIRKRGVPTDISYLPAMTGKNAPKKRRRAADAPSVDGA